MKYRSVRQWYYWNIYLRSPGWALTKWMRKAGKCAKCGTKTGLDMHHKNYSGYKPYNLMNLIFPDLVSEFETLCRKHHRQEHERNNDGRK